MTTPSAPPSAGLEPDTDTSFDVGEAFSALTKGWRVLALSGALGAALGLGVSYLMTPRYTATLSLLPPQQSSAGSSALASLGALGSLASLSGGLRTPADQYAALLQSRTVADAIITRFKLVEVYRVEKLADARDRWQTRARVRLDKKDGLIVVEVDDNDPQRAADLANQHVDELRRLTDRLSMSEAQQRRSFFEKQMLAARDRMAQAQFSLQNSGFNEGALRAEPRLAAEGYARLKAELTSAEIRLDMLRRSHADSTPEVREQQALVAGLTRQLRQNEHTPAQDRTAGSSRDADYLSRYRDFKYQETLFELYTKQFELARIDESREGSLIQVLDKAIPPESPSRPKRGQIAAGFGSVFLALTALVLVGRHSKRRWEASAARHRSG